MKKTAITLEMLKGNDSLTLSLLARTDKYKDTRDSRKGTHISGFSNLNNCVENFPDKHFVKDEKNGNWAIAVGINPDELKAIVEEAHQYNKDTLNDRLAEAMREVCNEEKDFVFSETDEQFQIHHGKFLLFFIEKNPGGFWGKDERNFGVLERRILAYKKLLQLQKENPRIKADVSLCPVDNRLKVQTIIGKQISLKFEHPTEQEAKLKKCFGIYESHQDYADMVIDLAVKHKLTVNVLEFGKTTYSLDVDAISKPKSGYEIPEESVTVFKSDFYDLKAWAEELEAC